MPLFSDDYNAARHKVDISHSVMLSLGLGLGLVSCGLGLELCGLVNNVARPVPADS